MADFPVYPLVAFLKAGEKQDFRFPFEEIEGPADLFLGNWDAESKTYQAPAEILSEQKLELIFRHGDLQASVSVFLLSDTAQKKWFRGDWVEIPVGDLVLESNVWGASGDSEIDLAITDFTLSEDRYSGWSWAVANQDASRIQCYPELVYGWKPWRRGSSCAELPQKVKDLTTVRTRYETLGNLTGSANLAYDCWLINGSTSRVESIAAEVMIWEQWQGLRPIGSRQGTLDTPFGQYEFWAGETQTWQVYTYRKMEQANQGNLDLKRFLDHLQSLDYIQPDHYLASVELGNEVATGAGATLIKNYQIQAK